MTSAYHPQTNGLVERLNQTTQNVLLKLVNEHQDNWDDLLPSALFAIHTSQQKSTKYTPFELMFNRKVVFVSCGYWLTIIWITSHSFCRKAKLPVELELEAANGQAEAVATANGQAETDSDAEGDESQTDIQSMIESKLSGMLALRKKLFDKASDNIKRAQERYKKDYDRKRSQSEVCSFSDYCKYIL